MLKSPGTLLPFVILDARRNKLVKFCTMKPLNQFKESSDNLQAKIEIVEDAEDSIYKLYSKHNWRGRRHTKKYARLGHAAETTITTPFSNVVSQCAIS